MNSDVTTSPSLVGNNARTPFFETRDRKSGVRERRKDDEDDDDDDDDKVGALSRR
jgi:hypothetical protein